MNTLSRQNIFNKKNINIIEYDRYVVDENLVYISFEIQYKRNIVLGYSSIYILNPKKDDLSLLKDKINAYTDDLDIFMNESFFKKEKPIIYLEKIFIKQEYRNCGVGKFFINSFLRQKAIFAKVNEIFLSPNPIACKIEHKNFYLDKLINYYKTLGFEKQMLGNHETYLMKKVIA